MTEEYQNEQPHQKPCENVSTIGNCDVAYLRGTGRACE